MADETQVQEVTGSGVTEWVENQVRNTPWWLISIAFHLIVLAGMTVITFNETVQQESVAQIITRSLAPKRLDLERPIVDDFNVTPGFTREDSKIVPRDPEEPVLLDFHEAKDGDHNERRELDREDRKSMFGDPDKLSSEPGDGLSIGRGIGGNGPYKSMGIGGGAGESGGFGDPNGGGRENIRKSADSGRIGDKTKTTERAVTLGLLWLARHQNEDGSWSADKFDSHCNGGACRDAGDTSHTVGVSGLSMLAFLGAGYTHLSNDAILDPVTNKKVKFGKIVKSGLMYLVKQQDPEGCFGGRHGGRYMYNHSIAALAMTEAYGLTEASLLKDSAQRGIDFLCVAQNPYKGWRYSKQCGDNDTSVTGWCVMALKSADMAKLTVSKSAYDGASAWITECTDEAYYKTGYTAKGTGKVNTPHNAEWDHHESMTAVGMLCRIFINNDPKDPALAGGRQLLISDLPAYSGKKIDYYYWYYGSLALFQLEGADGKAWSEWNKSMVNALVPTQKSHKDGCNEGSWDASVDRWGEGGRVYSTAINVLTLEVYYRYASVFGGKRK